MKPVVLESWQYGDPAECVDRLRALHERQERAEKQAKEQKRR